MPPETYVPPLILASGSPRRRLLLAMAGYEFAAVAPDLAELRQPDERADEYVMRMAEEKAAAVAAGRPPGTCVIGFDTTVVLDGKVLGKPADAAEAADMLLSLAGRTHTVYTGFCLAVAGTEKSEKGIEASLVTMRPVSRAEAEAYAATGEPLDKAGAYALQGAGRGFVTKVAGSRSTVIGLPLERVVDLLRRQGITPVRGAGGGGLSDAV
jgi:septum formation protein